MNAVIKQDGLDNLRQQLSESVMMTLEYPFADQATITIEIAHPTQFNKSIRAVAWSETKLVKHFYRADSKRWNNELNKLVMLDETAWKAEMQKTATSMESECRKDPISFFNEC